MELETYLIIGVAAGLVLLALLTIAMSRRSREDGDRLRVDLMAELRALRGETEASVGKSMAAQGAAWEQQDKRLAELTAGLTGRQEILQQAVSDRLSAVERQLESIRTATATSLAEIRADNSEKLEAMRKTVDEKLQKTLEDRIGQSFKMVNEQLEQVYKGLGEMQKLATGVGDLRRMLGGVKTRGVWGEYQLAAILEQLLLPEQYAVNIITVPGSKDPVEFAIKLPGDGGDAVYLPIDSKFPLDAYDELAQAAEAGDAARVDIALKAYRLRLRAFAKTIRDKYVAPPATTDFAIMFLTTEGMYAEAVRLGLVDELQRDFKVSITGPTTMGAILNSLQMGFRTLAIQKQSSEVWRVLGAAKAEFEKFSEVLESARNRLRQADEDLDKLVGTRTRVITQKLRDVEKLPEEEAKSLIGD